MVGWVRGAALEFLISASHVIDLLHAVPALARPATPPRHAAPPRHSHAFFASQYPLQTTDPFIPTVIVPPLHDSDSSVMPV